MKVNVICESAFFNLKETFGGIHSAFVNHVTMIKKKNVDVVINSLQKADIVHIHSYGPFALYKLLFSTEPIVVMTHDVPQSFVGSVKGAKILLGLITRYFIFFFNKADLVITFTEKTKEDLLKSGITSKIVVLPNSLNDDLFKIDNNLRKEGREQYHFSDDDFVVLGVGKQIPRKGIGDFLAIAKKFPSLKFIWVGGKDVKALSPETAQQEELMKHLPDNVLLPGVIPYQKIPMMYNLADVFLFPSFQETQGLVILEAAACGLPFIVRDLPEYRLLYGSDYKACNSIDEFSDALQKLYEDKEYYEQEVAKCSSKVAKFSSSEIGAVMVDHYKSLL